MWLKKIRLMYLLGKLQWEKERCRRAMALAAEASTDAQEFMTVAAQANRSFMQTAAKLQRELLTA